MLKRIVASLIIVIAFVVSGCGSLGENVDTVNSLATQAAGGSNSDPETGSGDSGEAQTEDATPEPTPAPNMYDLTINLESLMVTAWGEVYGLPAGSEFTIVATQAQVGNYVVAILQQSGYNEIIKGGSSSIGVGQIRIDLAVIDENGQAGAVSVTFQPTLEGTDLNLNPRGGDFSGLTLPGSLTAAVGDAVYNALSGARNASLSRVDFIRLSLDNAEILVNGTLR